MNKKELELLHKKVFKLFNYKFDKDNYDVPEHWTSHAEAVNEGKEFTDDCDGFAMTMCELMIETGVPREDVKFIICFTETGEGHAVSGCTIDGVTYISENRFRRIYDWNDRSDYNWVMFMEFSQPGTWHKIDK